MNAIQESFTDKLFANYEANVKYQAIENAASHNGIFAALERRQSHVDLSLIHISEPTRPY